MMCHFTWSKGTSIGFVSAVTKEEAYWSVAEYGNPETALYLIEKRAFSLCAAISDGDKTVDTGAEYWSAGVLIDTGGVRTDAIGTDSSALRKAGWRTFVQLFGKNFSPVP